MAHFAQVNEQNIVTQVLVTLDTLPNEGADWLVENFGGTWIKTSYNTYAGQHATGSTPLRKNFAGIGYSYDPAADAFIPPKPADDWTLDLETYKWVAPAELPL